jgi:outer membrane protein TolC
VQLAFTHNNTIKQDREQLFAVGGSKLVANSRFLPTVELINQVEHATDLDSGDRNADARSISARFTQRVLEWGKDNPIDVALRAEQRAALFGYESRVAQVFSDVRRAFFFVKLKERQIAARRELLQQFETQAKIKQQRMEAGNLSVKIEVLTARLNVLNERTQINMLERQRFNRKAELLRLIGLPVGTEQVEFVGEMDRFALDGFDTNKMISLALAQSSELALAEALVTEQGRVLDQLRYEYYPDLRFVGAYENEYGQVGAQVNNQNGTWGLDTISQPGVWGGDGQDRQGLGLLDSETSLGGPDRGWFTAAQLRIPISQGGARMGRRIQTRATLNGLKAAAADAKDRIELAVREGHKLLTEQGFQVELAQENVNIERERFRIQEELRDAGKITDQDLETFRRAFFSAQDSLFQQQETLIDRQENLRLSIRYFK